MNEYLSDIKVIKKYNFFHAIFVFWIIIIFYFLLFWLYYKVYFLFLFTLLLLIIFMVIFDKFGKKYTKLASKRNRYYVFNLSKNWNYSDVIDLVDDIDKQIRRYDYYDNATVFKIKNKLEYHVVVINQSEFSISEYKKIRKKVNRSYDKEYNVSHNVGPNEAVTMFKINIIYCNYECGELYEYISNDARHCLRRVEGMMNVVIINNKLIIPSIRGWCTGNDFSRYVTSMKLIFKLFNIQINL